MKKFVLKWFTMIEMLITMVIVWILAVVLVEAYITVSKISLRVEQQKNISEESLTLTQIFQSISDEATIDYDKYGDKLKDSSWFVDVLYLTWENRSWTSIYTTWDCLDLDWNFQDNENEDISSILQDNLLCSLVLEQNGIQTNLNAQWKVIISKVKFRVIPYNDDKWYFSNWDNGVVINDIHQPAFWVFIHLYAPLYRTEWINKIDLPLQLFFNLNV